MTLLSQLSVFVVSSLSCRALSQSAFYKVRKSYVIHPYQHILFLLPQAKKEMGARTRKAKL